MHRIFLLALLAVTAPGVLRAQTARRAHRSAPHPAADSITLIADAYAHRLDSLSRRRKHRLTIVTTFSKIRIISRFLPGIRFMMRSFIRRWGVFPESRRKFPERFRALCLTFMGTAPTSFRVSCRLLL